MQTATDAFTTEVSDTTRCPKHGVFVSWKKNFDASFSFFTIGTSLVGGNDMIKGEVNAAPMLWDKYTYSDESTTALAIDYERELFQPLNSMSKAIADVDFNNTQERFTPNRDPDLGTAILPDRPIKIFTGFKAGGVDEVLPQFVGLTKGMPRIRRKSGIASFHANDFMDFIWNQKIDDESLFTAERSDQVIKRLLDNVGFATSQYRLDAGINRIGFPFFPKGTSIGSAIQKIAEAELGTFYEDEQGRFRFENRQHWSTQTSIVYNFATAEVIDEELPPEDNIINVVEVTAKPREVQQNQSVWNIETSYMLDAGETQEIWANLDDPMFEMDTPTSGGSTSYFKGNSEFDGSGVDKTDQLTLKSFDIFTNAAKMVFVNADSSPVYINQLSLWGRPAAVVRDIYYREQDDSSVTAYQEKPFKIDNDFIQSETFAKSIAKILLEDRSELEDFTDITIKANPQLQLGDRISWRGRYWFIYGIQAVYSISTGFIQRLKLVQRDLNKYFTIGSSPVGGTHKIAP